MASESNSLPPGFQFSEKLVAGRLDFDIVRLEDDERFHRGDRTDGIWKLTDEAREAIVAVIDEYYDRRPAIEENVSVRSESFAFRILEEDAEHISQLIAADLEIRFEIPDFSPSGLDENPDPLPYSDLISDVANVQDRSWSELPETSFDVEEDIEAAIPEGHSEPNFFHDDYLDYVLEFLVPAIQDAGWRGGHAWLLNLGMQELRNGRYEEAAYAFAGAKDGLTKHSLFDESRIQPLVRRSLNTLRDLCLLKAPDEYDFSEFDLYCEADVRDLIYVPEFISRPDIDDLNFRMNNPVWIANALVLVQGVAHAIGKPTISRTEVDPFGSGMTLRNASFVLKLANSLVSAAPDEVESDPIQYLEGIDLGNFTPDITITRTLRSVGYTIQMYRNTTEGVRDELNIDFDLIVAHGDDKYLVRAMRPEDRDRGTLEELIGQTGDLDHSLLLLYDRELESTSVSELGEQDGVEMMYINLQAERLSPVSAGYPRSFADFATEEEIRDEIERRFVAAQEAETTESKGDRLEELMAFIFEKAVPDTHVMTPNNRTSTEEIDLQLQNEEEHHPWTQLGAPINVECKNWNKAVGVDEIYSVYGKAKMTSPNSKGAILVSWEGVSDSQTGRNADGLLRDMRIQDLDILVLDQDDLSEIVETGDAQAVFERAYTNLYQR
mgnify:FL=1